MIVSRILLKNWRNFQHVDVQLRERQFVVGPNASGKSNFLDVFRFLRDIAKPEGGGLQKAVKDRNGVSKIRCLASRRDPEIGIEIHLAKNADESPLWRYAIGIKQESRGHRQAILSYERVWARETLILDRPTPEDEKDKERLKQTFLEQVITNTEFRDIARFLQSVTYLHLVPQLLRFPEFFQGKRGEDDPFGEGFLERIARTPAKTRKSRLTKIEQALKIAAPNLQQLKFDQDPVSGKPHLAALYSHWRPNAGWQREDQFSDGTLRLVGLLWSLLESDSLLLLEEPELSLNAAVVSRIASLIHRLQRQRKRQVLISTHSESLLSDKGIDGREVLLITPLHEGSRIETSTDIREVKTLLEAGLSVGEVVLPRSAPEDAHQLGQFE